MTTIYNARSYKLKKNIFYNLCNYCFEFNTTNSPLAVLMYCRNSLATVNFKIHLHSALNVKTIKLKRVISKPPHMSLVPKCTISNV